jgi:hypothetical protein
MLSATSCGSVREPPGLGERPDQPSDAQRADSYAKREIP